MLLALRERRGAEGGSSVETFQPRRVFLRSRSLHQGRHSEQEAAAALREEGLRGLKHSNLSSEFLGGEKLPALLEEAENVGVTGFEWIMFSG